MAGDVHTSQAEGVPELANRMAADEAALVISVVAPRGVVGPKERIAIGGTPVAPPRRRSARSREIRSFRRGPRRVSDGAAPPDHTVAA